MNPRSSHSSAWMCTASVSPGSAPSTKIGPVTGLPYQPRSRIASKNSGVVVSGVRVWPVRQSSVSTTKTSPGRTFATGGVRRSNTTVNWSRLMRCMRRIPLLGSVSDPPIREFGVGLESGVNLEDRDGRNHRHPRSPERGGALRYRGDAGRVVGIRNRPDRNRQWDRGTRGDFDYLSADRDHA